MQKKQKQKKLKTKNKTTTQKTKTMATPTLAKNLRVYPGAPNSIEKPGIQRTLCIRTTQHRKQKR
jgi:hypothetical protein